MYKHAGCNIYKTSITFFNRCNLKKKYQNRQILKKSCPRTLYTIEVVTFIFLILQLIFSYKKIYTKISNILF